jgi:hypothetical protein
MKLIAAAALAASIATPSFAQGIPCAPREQMLQIIIDRMGGVRQATGEGGHGSRMELFASPDGEWVMVLHLQDGRTCLLASGNEFEPTSGLQPARGIPA